MPSTRASDVALRAPERSARAAIPTLGLFVLVAASTAAQRPPPAVASFAGSLAWLLAFSFACTLLHELAHAACAVAVGLRVSYVFVGVGSPWMRIALGRCLLVLYALPVTGVSLVWSPTSTGLRRRLVPAFLAGPLMNALIVLVVVVAARTTGSGALLGRSLWLESLAVVNGLQLLASLIPARTTSALTGAAIESDGLQALAAPFRSADRLAEVVDVAALYDAHFLFGCHRYDEAVRSAEAAVARRPGDLRAELVLANALLFKPDPARARAALLPLLARAGSGPVRAVVLSDLALADIAVGTPELLREADRHSEEAWRSDLRRPELNGARGAVLVELGRIEEAVPLLRRALRRSSLRANRAIAACFLAVAHAEPGELRVAREYLDYARRLSRACPFLPRAERAVSSR